MQCNVWLHKYTHFAHLQEMLPMIVNSNLSLGAAKMSRHKCVVKRLEAIQNIGAMDVLCTDKTGTLTMDRVQVHTALDVFGRCGG
jgi:Mg2+-importing ATPase